MDLHLSRVGEKGGICNGRMRDERCNGRIKIQILKLRKTEILKGLN